MNNITGKAIIILIDNSPCSIDGDFYPNRLEAQKIAIERLSTYLFSISIYSQVALITMSADEFGIRSSFTMTQNKINSVLRNINASSHLSQKNSKYSLESSKRSIHLENIYPILLEKSLKTALVMIDHYRLPNANNDIIDSVSNPPPHIEKHILIFICSNHDLTNHEKVHNIKQAASKKDTTIDVVAFGPDVNEKQFLRDLTQSEDSLTAPSLNILNSSDLNPSLNQPSSESSFKNKKNNKKCKKVKSTNSNIFNNSSLSNLSSLSGEFLDIPSAPNDILSDIILSSRIGTGSVKPQIPIKALLKTNPDLFEAVYDSLLSYKRQAGAEIYPSIESQIQMLENCAFPVSKPPQRTSMKLQKESNSIITTTIISISPSLSENKNPKSKLNSCDKKNNNSAIMNENNSNVNDESSFDSN